MALCSQCGAKLADGAAFCSECGAPVGSRGNPGRRESFDGEVRRCPNCGAALGSFVSVCSTCGFELRNVGISSQVNDLASRLEATADSDQKNELIRNFHIPNTKEDIYEFFILAASNIEAGGANTDAWYAKLDQAYKKAMLVFGDGPELERLKKLMNEGSGKRAARSLFRTIAGSRALQTAALFFFGLLLVVIGQFGGSVTGGTESPFFALTIVGAACIWLAVMVGLISIPVFNYDGDAGK